MGYNITHKKHQLCINFNENRNRSLISSHLTNGSGSTELNYKTVVYVLQHNKAQFQICHQNLDNFASGDED